MKGPAESGQICSVGRRKIAKNKRCYANTLRPRSRMLLKVMKGVRGSSTQRSTGSSPNKNLSGKIFGFAAAAVMPFFGQQPAGCVPRTP